MLHCSAYRLIHRATGFPWKGIAIGECTGTERAFFWSDDANDDNHALRVDTIPCGAFVP